MADEDRLVKIRVISNPRCNGKSLYQLKCESMQKFAEAYREAKAEDRIREVARYDNWDSKVGFEILTDIEKCIEDSLRNNTRLGDPAQEEILQLLIDEKPVEISSQQQRNEEARQWAMKRANKKRRK